MNKNDSSIFKPQIKQVFETRDLALGQRPALGFQYNENMAYHMILIIFVL
jgi:hypothetical protein